MFQPRLFLVVGLLFSLAASALSLTCGFDIACSPDQNFITAVIDTTPPVISSPRATNTTNTTADIEWSTSEDANGLVQYGTTTAYGSARASSTYSIGSHVLGLLSLSPGTIYHYKITSCDVNRNCASTPDLNFSTTGSSDVTPPVLSNVQATNIIDRNVTISFTTNELGDTNIQYDINNAPGFSFSVYDPALVNGLHVRTITGLNPLTGYKFRVASRDAAGNASAFANGTNFTTTDTLPQISGIAVISITPNSATIQWSTDINADSQIEYGATASYGFTTTRDAIPKRSHQQTMGGLNPGTTYHFRVLAKRCSANPC